MASKVSPGMAMSAGAALCFVLAAGFLPVFAGSEVHVNVNIGAPPPVIVQSPPPMLFLPEPAVYVAVGTPYDIFFIDGRYYYFHGNNWFWAPVYGGPWVHVVHTGLPPGLRRYEVVKLREYREREYRVYKVQGSKFKGKSFMAVEGPPARGHGHDDDHDSDGHGKGRGRGHNK